MTRINLILLLVLVCCALSVVTSQHRARKLFIQLQAEQDAERRLDAEWRELQIEVQTLGNGKRIEQKAVRELGMVLPDAKRNMVLRPQSSASTGAATPTTALGAR